MARSRRPKKLTAEARSAALEATAVVREIRVRSRAPSDLVPLVISGHEVTVPAAALDGFADLLAALGAGTEVVVAPADITIGTTELAKALGVSPTWAAALIDRGDLPATLTGTKRRVSLGSLAVYQRLTTS